jgi:hypothetical protein
MKIARKSLSTKPVAAPKRGKPSVRLPQRSEAVSGDEAKGVLTPIAAAQKKKPKRK